MHQIQLTDKVYENVKRRANKAGFDSVDEYVVDLLEDDELVQIQNLDHLFTPERLAIIDKSLANVKAGGVTYTMEDVEKHLDQQRDVWIKENGK